MATSKIPENINRGWTLVTPIGDGAKAWNSTKTEMLCLATWPITSAVYGELSVVIPKIQLEAGKTSAFLVGDRYDTGIQYHLQVNITYDSLGTLTSVTPVLYEGANERPNTVYRFYYR